MRDVRVHLGFVSLGERLRVCTLTEFSVNCPERRDHFNSNEMRVSALIVAAAWPMGRVTRPP